MRRADFPHAILRNDRPRFGDNLAAAKFPQKHEIMGASRHGFRNAGQHGRFRQGRRGGASDAKKPKRTARSLRHGANR